MHAHKSLAGVAMLNAVAGLAARLSTLVIAIALTPFVLGRLGPALYGISAATGSMVEYLLLLRGGLGVALRRYVTVTFHAGDRELAARYYAVGFWWMAVLRLVVVVIGVALSRWLCVFMRVPPSLLTDATGGVILVVVAGGLQRHRAGVRGPDLRHRPHRAAVAGAGGRRGAQGGAGGAGLPALRAQPHASTARPSAWWSCSMAVGDRRGERARPRRAARRAGAGLRLAARCAARCSASAGSGWSRRSRGILYLATDNLMIGGIYGSEYVTRYSLGTRWAPMITILLSTGVSALTPLLTQLEARGEEDRSRSMVLRAAAVNSALGVPLCLVPCIVGDIFLVQLGRPAVPRQRALHDRHAGCRPWSSSRWSRCGWRWWRAGASAGSRSATSAWRWPNPILSLILALPLKMGLLGFALGNAVAMLLKNLLLRPLLGRGEEGIPSLWATFLTLPVALLGGAPALVALWLLRPVYSDSLHAVLLAGFLGGLALPGRLAAHRGGLEGHARAGAGAGRPAARSVGAVGLLLEQVRAQLRG